MRKTDYRIIAIKEEIAASKQHKKTEKPKKKKEENKTPATNFVYTKGYAIVNGKVKQKKTKRLHDGKKTTNKVA
jgi:hypothetical protein